MNSWFKFQSQNKAVSHGGPEPDAGNAPNDDGDELSEASVVCDGEYGEEAEEEFDSDAGDGFVEPGIHDDEGPANQVHVLSSDSDVDADGVVGGDAPMAEPTHGVEVVEEGVDAHPSAPVPEAAASSCDRPEAEAGGDGPAPEPAAGGGVAAAGGEDRLADEPLVPAADGEPVARAARRFGGQRRVDHHPKSFYFGQFYIKYRADNSILYPDRLLGFEFSAHLGLEPVLTLQNLRGWFRSRLQFASCCVIGYRCCTQELLNKAPKPS